VADPIVLAIVLACCCPYFVVALFWILCNTFSTFLFMVFGWREGSVKALKGKKGGRERERGGGGGERERWRKTKTQGGREGEGG
jgi:hypothetical protein